MKKLITKDEIYPYYTLRKDGEISIEIGGTPNEVRITVPTAVCEIFMGVQQLNDAMQKVLGEIYEKGMPK